MPKKLGMSVRFSVGCGIEISLAVDFGTWIRTVVGISSNVRSYTRYVVGNNVLCSLNYNVQSKRDRVFVNTLQMNELHGWGNNKK